MNSLSSKLFVVALRKSTAKYIPLASRPGALISLGLEAPQAIKPALKKTLKSFQTDEYGGAPLLGLNGLVVKTHGSSKAKEVCNSIIQCVNFKEQKINEKIKEKLLFNEK